MNKENKLSFLVFNFGKQRLKNLWYTMKVVKDIQDIKAYDDIEFILIEHGEEEFSKDMAAECGFQYEYYFDPLLTSHRATLRNKAVEAATADWVILHDNDIVPDPTFFDDIKEMIDTHPQVEYFSNFFDVINLDPRLTDILIKDIKTNNKFEYGYVNGTDRSKTHNFDQCQIRDHGFWTFTEATGGTFTVKKDVFLATPFDENYKKWGAEDNAFKLHTVEAIGWGKFGLINKSLLHSDHSTDHEYDPATGIIQVFDEDVSRNRQMLYDSIDKVASTLDTDLWTLKDDGDKFFTTILKKDLKDL
jgi:hypothetical protein